MRIISIFLKVPSRVLLLRDNNNALRLVCLLTDDHISLIIGIVILKSKTQADVYVHGVGQTQCEILHVCCVISNSHSDNDVLVLRLEIIIFLYEN